MKTAGPRNAWAGRFWLGPLHVQFSNEANVMSPGPRSCNCSAWFFVSVRVGAARKCRAVKARRVIGVEVERHAVQVVGRPQALGQGGGLLLLMVRGGLGVGTGMESGTVETESHAPKIQPGGAARE